MASRLSYHVLSALDLGGGEGTAVAYAPPKPEQGHTGHCTEGLSFKESLKKPFKSP